MVTHPKYWDTLSFLICYIQMLKFKEAQRAPVASRALWNETARVVAKIPAAKLRMEPILTILKKPVPAQAHFGVYLWVYLLTFQVQAHASWNDKPC